MHFFSGGPKPPLIKFCIFRLEKTCPPEEKKAPPLRKKSAPLKIQSARKFTSAHPKCYMGRRVLGGLSEFEFEAFLVEGESQVFVGVHLHGNQWP